MNITIQYDLNNNFISFSIGMANHLLKIVLLLIFTQVGGASWIMKDTQNNILRVIKNRAEHE
jgi:hypothetical protein